MNYMSCDHCASEFVINDTTASSLRCPDCNQWVDTYGTSNYMTASFKASYAYDNFDMDNYGYDD